jgi:hypothetical protein
MIGLHNWLNNLVEGFTFYGGGGKGGGGGGGQTQTTSIPAWMKPYVTYGLNEAQTLYQTQNPQYYPGQTYVDPSAQTQAALQATQNRALMGNPLLPAAQQQQQNVIGGQYLQNNPYFNQALQGAAQASTQQYYDAINQATSGAAGAGRYGSNAMQEQQQRAAGQLANALTNQAGQLAYSNYGAERARQEAAAAQAPGLAQADYFDINQLLQAGQMGEGYQQNALEGDVARFNFQQNAPYQKLASYLGAVYGVPGAGGQTTTTQGGESGGKIVCSMMNEFYGTSPFRNRVWLLQSESMPNAKAIEKGYHTIFLPLVAFAKKDGFLNKVVRKSLEHIARHRTADVYREMRNGKRDVLGRMYRNILEPICYLTGKMKGAK